MRSNTQTNMEDTTPHPQIIPQSTEPATYGHVAEVTPKMPTPPAVPHKKFMLPKWAIGAIGVFLLLLVLMVATSSREGSATVTPTPTPTATASAVVNRTLSSFATESAFTKFEADLDALSKGIQNTQVQNQQLLPPRLELPLGF
jgi:hypothetical protein